MKRRDLEKRLVSLGWWEVGGSKHSKWTNGFKVTMVPRHSEINEWTAKNILSFATKHPGKAVKK